MNRERLPEPQALAVVFTAVCSWRRRRSSLLAPARPMPP